MQSLEKAKTDKALEGEIVDMRLTSKNRLTKFKKDPIKTLAEISIGLLTSSKGELLKGTARIFHAVRTGRGVREFFNQMEDLQIKGDIQSDEEIERNKYAEKSLVDLMGVIDSNPDEDFLRAVKSMYFLLIGADVEDKKRMRIYTLMQILETLNSSELCTLRNIYSLHKRIPWIGMDSSTSMWLEAVRTESYHEYLSIVEKDEEKLIELRIITDRIHSDRSGINRENWRLTDIGMALCELIYEAEAKFYSLKDEDLPALKG